MDKRVTELPPPSEEAQLRALLAAMEAAHQGDFTHRLPLYGTHRLVDQLAQAFNTQLDNDAALTRGLREVERVLGAVARGELRQKMALALEGQPLKGALLRIGTTVNALVDQLSVFTAEVIRVAREVGAEGKLGGQAHVPGVSGVWKELTDTVNFLVGSVSEQVRDISQVAAAVARGELDRKISVEMRGEMLALKNTVNTMVDQLSAFAAEVNRVAKEVGTEEKLSGHLEVQGVTGVWKDLSDNVNVTEQLALASKYKSEFLANMSHELRTPLNSLLILARVLAENKERRLSSKEVEYAKTIHASGTELLSLINEILDLSKIEAGKMRVEPYEVRLSEVKEFIERSFRHVAEQKGLGFSVHLGEGLPATLHTDVQRLQQVLKNLLSNAFKFTGSGRVDLHITPADGQGARFDTEALQRAERVLAFSVVDSGIGIPRDKQKLIFEAFQQADGTTSRKYGGTGLGLSISRAMAHLLGGELHLESQPGKGSTFTLYLPGAHPLAEGSASSNMLQVPAPPAPNPQLNSTPVELDARLAGGTVLIVDDDIRNIFALASALESQGMAVLHAENGRVGLEVLRAHPEVDVVLMDMMMPEMDGYETMRAIRKDSRFATLPIIAITAKALKEDRELCLAAGASDYLPKPVDTPQLLELLRRWRRQPGSRT
ncbi:ATP-binding protein [Hyalangium rubrum]|uniref:histidine kinase n=1 Tax=Hyalangium rubrum TaxID=3103134 RepID=A0ABU5HCQ9_9BACT|nr:ATP-binding protein [Hyalangium sp. s54d21]MDY7231242.1 ATP-binding protein [Hyalangium sp. s54d21]